MLNKLKHNEKLKVPFEFIPPTIEFSSFEERSTVKATLKIRNKDNVAHRIRVVRPDSLTFSVKSRLGMGKLAPGMELVVDVIFKPEERKDYAYDLMFITEHGDLSVPVRALGPRPNIICYPSRIDFGRVPLRHEKEERVTLTNEGDAVANIKLSANAPFRITPPLLQIPPQETFTTSAYFTPLFLDNYQGHLHIEYEFGSKTKSEAVPVRGIAKQLINEIKLDTSLIVLPDSYASLTSYKSVRLRNDSDIKIDFCWKQSGTECEDDTHRSMSELLQEEKESDAADFIDQVFSIEPLRGEIWPHSQLQFIISFTPQTEGEFESTAFCQVSGRETRIPLRMRAEGFGPHIKFLYDNLEIGDISINSVHDYKFVAENVGLIPGFVTLINPTSLFGKSMEFLPKSFHIPPGQTETIQARFCSDVVGSFSENLCWSIEGSQTQLNLTIKGRVIGPSFHFDVEQIDFEDVAFNFLISKFINITNTSDIPMRYSLRIPNDGSLLQREFDLIPASGELAPRTRKKIQVDFLPTLIQEYNVNLIVDIEDVGQGVMSIPIKAKCRVPDVSLVNKALDFGECFIHHPYTQQLELINNSNLSAKYEILQPGQEANNVGKFIINENRGIVPGMSTLYVPITMEAQKVGSIFVPLYIKILGSSGIPFEVSISAQGLGPVVEVESTLIDWGRIPVLTDSPKSIVLKNDSPIPAVFDLSCDSEVFCLPFFDGTVAPFSSQEIKISAFLDEVGQFSSILVVEIENGETHNIRLIAKGKGHTLHPSISLDFVDFGEQLTKVTCLKTFVLENQGRKTHSIQWMPESTRKRGKEDAIEPFWIRPDRASIPGKEAVQFAIYGKSEMKGRIGSKFVCKSSFGKLKKTIFCTEISADFQPPLVVAEPKEISFEYCYQSENGPKEATKYCTLRNNSQLQLTLELYATEGPFSIDIMERTLDPGETFTVTIKFDPAYRKDRISHSPTAQLEVRYREHPQIDCVPLMANIEFPNLTFSSSQIEFGHILNNKQERVSITLANPGSVPVHYWWAFEQSSDARNVSSLFDILPVRGVVDPGEICEAQFLHKGFAKGEFEYKALCIAQGGPEYEFLLKGESSDIQFKLDKEQLLLGSVLYDETAETTFTITNTGKVELSFSIECPQVSDDLVVDVIPKSGHLPGGEKKAVRVRFCPGLPKRMETELQLFVAHLAPKIITIEAQGALPSVDISLPCLPIDTKPVIERLSIWKTARTCSRSTRKKQLDRSLPNLADFSCEFGYIFKGTIQKKQFTLTNTGVRPLTLRIDQEYCAQYGIAISPSVVRNLLVNEEKLLELCLETSTLQANSLQARIPIELNGNSLIHICTSAKLVIPQIGVEPSTLRFGLVRLCQTAFNFVQLHNPNPLPVEWKLVYKARAKEKTSTLPLLRCFPNSGTLLSKATTNVQIAFTPAAERSYACNLILKLAHNPEPQTIHCIGAGYDPSVFISPPEIEFSPSLPFNESFQEIVCENSSEEVVEIYSINFDTQFRKEAMLLKNATGFDERNVLYFSPRVPGKQLVIKAQEPQQENDSVSSYADTHETQSENDAEEPKSHKKGLVIVFDGPKLSGKTTHAKLTAEKCKLSIVDAQLMLARAERKLNKQNQKDETFFKENTCSLFEKLSFLLKIEPLPKEGIVVDNLDFSQNDKKEFARALLTASTNKYTVVWVILCAQELQTKIRETQQVEAGIFKELQDIVIPEVSEEDIEKMSPEEEEKYQRNIQLHRDLSEQLSSVQNDLESLHNQLSEYQKIEDTSKSLTKKGAKKKKGSRPASKKAKLKSRSSTPSEPAETPLQELFETEIELWRKEVSEKFQPQIRSKSRKGSAKSTEERILLDNAAESKVISLNSWLPIEENSDAIILALPNIETDEVPEPETKPLPEPYVLQYVRKSNCTSQSIEEQGPFFIMKDAEPFRWVLQPNTTQQLKVVFCPRRPGNFETKLTFGVLGSEKRLCVGCKGSSSYPDILRNSKFFFPDVIKKRMDSRPISLKYISEQRLFDFGPIALRKMQPRSSKGSGPQTTDSFDAPKLSRTAKFRVKNTSNFSAHIKVCFGSTDGLKNFSLEPDEFHLQPRELKYLSVTADPRSVQEYKERLIILVRDNPEPFWFHVACQGTHPELIATPTGVNFGVLKAKTTKECLVNIENTSAMIIKWSIDSSNGIPECVNVEPTKGVLNPKGKQQLKIVVSAEKDFSLENQNLKITFSEHCPTPPATFSLELPFQGECSVTEKKAQNNPQEPKPKKKGKKKMS